MRYMCQLPLCLPLFPPLANLILVLLVLILLLLVLFCSVYCYTNPACSLQDADSAAETPIWGLAGYRSVGSISQYISSDRGVTGDGFKEG